MDLGRGFGARVQVMVTFAATLRAPVRSGAYDHQPVLHHCADGSGAKRHGFDSSNSHVWMPHVDQLWLV